MKKALRSTRVLTQAGLAPATVLVDGERISAVRGWNDVSSDLLPGAGPIDLIDFGDRVLLPGWISLPLTIFFLVGITNAVNLADGLDG